MPNERSTRLTALGWLVAATLFSGSARAEPELGATLSLELGYTSNLFHYQNRRLDALRAGDQTGPGERFDGLEGPSDVVTTPGAEVSASWGHAKKIDTEVTLGARYALHARNGIANYLRLDAELAQDLTRRDTLVLDTDFIPSRLKKNYAYDEVGGVRLFDQATYLRWRARLGYERKWAKRWWSDVTIGVNLRRFDDPFANRDDNAFVGGLGVEHRPWKRWTFRAEVEAARTLTPDGVELGVRVDRSHVQVEPGLGVALDLSHRWDVEAGIAYRWRSYTTDEMADGVRFERLDRRLTLEAEVTKGFGRAWTVGLDVSYVDSDAGRFDPNDDPDDFGYDELQAAVVVEYAF